MDWTGESSEEVKRLIAGLFPDHVASQIYNADSISLREGTFEGTVLFIDIRKFTTLSEKLSPGQVAEILNLLFRDFIDIIFSHGGSINKFMGDAILVTFGIPVPARDAAFDAVCCSLAMLDHISLFNQVKPDFLESPLEIGIGISTGKVFAGAIASYRRLEYTVIGDTVNTASRLQNLSKKTGSPILIDSKTREHLGTRWSGKTFRYQLRGKADSERLYTVTALSHRNRHGFQSLAPQTRE